MPKYTVKAPLNHDLKEYSPDDTIEMPEEQAAVLQSLGVVSEEVVEASGKKGKAE